MKRQNESNCPIEFEYVPKMSGKAFLRPVLPELRNSWMGGSLGDEEDPATPDGPAPCVPRSITANIFNTTINNYIIRTESQITGVVKLNMYLPFYFIFGFGSPCINPFQDRS